jgi:hypothetical protein
LPSCREHWRIPMPRQNLERRALRQGSWCIHRRLPFWRAWTSTVETFIQNRSPCGSVG